MKRIRETCIPRPEMLSGQLRYESVVARLARVARPTPIPPTASIPTQRSSSRAPTPRWASGPMPRRWRAFPASPRASPPWWARILNEARPL
jgi:hypothetical protein